MARLKHSPRDEVYLSSTSFEVYMVTGGVFLLGFTLSFILSVISHREMLLWPGAFVSVVAAYVVLKALERREYRAKLREVEADENRRNAASS